VLAGLALLGATRLVGAEASCLERRSDSQLRVDSRTWRSSEQVATPLEIRVRHYRLAFPVELVARTMGSRSCSKTAAMAAWWAIAGPAGHDSLVVRDYGVGGCVTGSRGRARATTTDCLEHCEIWATTHPLHHRHLVLRMERCCRIEHGRAGAKQLDSMGCTSVEAAAAMEDSRD
jgi:hypothetical protein